MNKPSSLIRVAIIGAGALGQQMAQHLRQDGRMAVAGFFDDVQPLNQQTPTGPVLGRTAEIGAAYAAGRFDQLLLGIGYNHLAFRQRIFEQLAAEIPFATFVHGSAYVDPSAQLGPGCFISPGCIIDLNVKLGPNSFLYPGCVVAHDTELTGHSFLAPAVRLAGHVLVAERCFLGIGTTVIDSRTVGPDVRTGGGAVVVADLLMPGTYAGVPARMLPGRAEKVQ
jgi:sugar O-acyltransferase (sialic acid O-acetyltransferase NeuD family)